MRTFADEVCPLDLHIDATHTHSYIRSAWTGPIEQELPIRRRSLRASRQRERVRAHGEHPTFTKKHTHTDDKGNAMDVPKMSTEKRLLIDGEESYDERWKSNANPPMRLVSQAA